jgi:biotin/methionine sulfoxide reductase
MDTVTFIDECLTSAHWGAYRVKGAPQAPSGLAAWAGDPAPSPIGLAMWEAYQSPLRIRRPAIREGWLRGRFGDPSRGAGRGTDRFVEVSWDHAIALTADALGETIAQAGNEAVFGGSYGWSSAGRFHHAQSQVHRFLNSLGGYVRHTDSYSLGAGRVLLPHILAPMEYLLANQHDWGTLAAHTRLFVSFGGAPAKNAQVGAGGASEHRLPDGLQALAAAGCRFVNFSPVRSDLTVPDQALEWIPIRPHTDTAVMLALACETLLAGREASDFLASHCTGFERWRDYLLGRQDGILRNADWAAPIAGVESTRLRRLAAELAGTRSLINVSWALQRADHGEQAFWAGVSLACVLGQVGLPGGGIALAYGAANTLGSPHRLLPGPTLPQGANPVRQFIPVARIADMLESPGAPFTYNGETHAYPHIRTIVWAGGNPFHHHQDLHRLARVWRRPDTIIVNEQFWNAHARMADIVLPATCMLEREDIGHSTRDCLMIAMRQVLQPPGEALDDYAIYSAVAARLGREQEFTEGRASRQWLEHLYEQARVRSRAQQVELPEFSEFWRRGGVRLPANDQPVIGFDRFREDPIRHRLDTPSGRIELFSERIAGFGLSDCPGHASWIEPHEWLGSPLARRFPLHLLSDQPHTKLHSQLDHSAYSLANKVAGREPIHIHPDDAGARGIADGDLVRVFNDRGACLAGARIDDGLRPGVVKLSTGAWWDPERPGDPSGLDRHGNPNTLTRDMGASGLSQGCAAQSCLVQVEAWQGEAPPLRAFSPPNFGLERSAP